MISDDEHLPRVGARLGPYEVVRELGRGGMGRVYEVRHVELGKRAAIKVMP
jgi:serine/threonine protein kinase